jgi:hypothetical protein
MNSWTDPFIFPTDEEIAIAEEVVRLTTSDRTEDDFFYDFQSQDYENPLRKRNFLKEVLDKPDLMRITILKPKI